MCRNTIIVVKESLFQNPFCRSFFAAYVEGWFMLEPTLLEQNLHTLFCANVIVSDCTLQTLTFRYYKIFVYRNV